MEMKLLSLNTLLRDSIFCLIAIRAKITNFRVLSLGLILNVQVSVSAFLTISPLSRSYSRSSNQVLDSEIIVISRPFGSHRRQNDLHLLWRDLLAPLLERTSRFRFKTRNTRHFCDCTVITSITQITILTLPSAPTGKPSEKWVNLLRK